MDVFLSQTPPEPGSKKFQGLLRSGLRTSLPQRKSANAARKERIATPSNANSQNIVSPSGGGSSLIDDLARGLQGCCPPSFRSERRRAQSAPPRRLFTAQIGCTPLAGHRPRGMPQGAPHVPRTELPPRREDSLAQRAFGACVTRERLGGEAEGLRDGVRDLQQSHQEILEWMLGVVLTGKAELRGCPRGNERQAQTERAQLPGGLIHVIAVLSGYVPGGRLRPCMRVRGTRTHGASRHARVRSQGDRAPENPCGHKHCRDSGARIHTAGKANPPHGCCQRRKKN